MSNMPKSHILLLQHDKRFLPRKGDICSMACEFAFACANHEEGSTCQGFQLLNGESERIIRHNLTDSDKNYLKNSFNFIQRSMDNGNLQDAIAVYNDIAKIRTETNSTVVNDDIIHTPADGISLSRSIDRAKNIPKKPSTERITIERRLRKSLRRTIED